jgi:hypothetical protein
MGSIPTTPHQDEQQAEELETWEIFRQAIPRGESDAVARILRRRGIECSGAQVRTWMNDPDVDDKRPAAPNGRRNPLDEFLEVMNAVGARGARGADLLAKRVAQENARIQADHGREELLKDLAAIRKARKIAQEFLSTTEHLGDG